MGKIVAYDSIKNGIQKNEEKVILVGGCFDVLHPGHVEFLTAAKQLSGILVVLLESDSSVSRLKGDKRPIHSQKQRAFVLSHIDVVDVIVTIPQLNSDNDYNNVIKTINPSVIAVTEGDPLLDIKKSHARKIGARVVNVMKRNNEHSSTKVMARLNI